MFRFKNFPIAAILAVFMLLTFIGSSEAIEIEELRSYNDTNEEYDWGNPSFTFYVRTNEPYGGITWSANGNYENGILGNGESRDHYFSFSNLPGDIKGNYYEIEVYVWAIDAEGNTTRDTATYDFTVYKPVVRSSTKLGVYGYECLYSIVYNHPYITPSGYAYARNNGNEWNFNRTIFHRFRHLVTGPRINKMEEDETEGGVQKLKENKPYRASIPSHFPIYVGDGRDDEEYTSNVYMRLEVAGRSDSTHTLKRGASVS